MLRLTGAVVLAASLACAGCTTSGKIYRPGKDKKEDYSAKNTAAAVIGTALVAGLIVAAANSKGGGGYYSPAYDRDWAWDYQPLNGQWVCRGLQTGYYTAKWRCQNKLMYDYWP
jgi:hypothetical protein